MFVVINLVDANFMIKVNLFYLFFLLSFVSFAQFSKGKVVDRNGMPIPEVSIIVLNGKQSTITDSDGTFSIKTSVGDRLQFSKPTFETTTIKATTSMTVTLEPKKVTQLDEVIVVGYGTKKAGSITGSVAQIKSADILRTPAQSAIQAIQGKAAGVNIVTNDEPGANPSIRIRGLGTVLGGRDPLYVIDGVESGGLNLSPSEIATLDILKDASSLAIYGQKGSNGVVVITTKKGKKGGIKITYDSYYGQKSIQRKVRMSDSYRYAYYNNVALGSTSYFSFDQPYNTNWLNQITSNGEVTSNAVSISGASDNANYYLGVTNYKEKGILNGTQFDRTNINSRNEFRAFDNKLKITQAINISNIRNTPKPLSAFTNAYKQAPIMPVKYENGRWGVPLLNPSGVNDIQGIRYNNVANPAAQLFYSDENNKNLNLLGSVGAEYKISDSFKINSNFGANFDWSKGYSFTASREIWLSQNPTSTAENYSASSPINILNQRRGSFYEWNWDNYFTYKKSFNSHDFTFVGGTSRSTKNNNEYLSGTRWNVPEQSNYWSLGLSSYNTPTAPGSVVSNIQSTPIISIAYFGRLEYEYASKYLFSASLRREGISSFIKSKKWGMFPAVSAGWILSKENFLENIKFVNFLKLRVGYGEVGNGNGNAVNTILFPSGYNYAFGTNQNINAGTSIPYQVDPNLTWETMKEFDFGVDFTILNNKISGTIDIYNRNSDDVILPVELPSVLSPGDVNLSTGKVSNKGFELTLKWNDAINDKFNYWVGGNFSYNKNTLSKVYNSFFTNLIGGGLGNGQWTKQVKEGESLGSFYVYQVTGLNQDGGFTYSTERVNAGSFLPTYTYGINFGANYRKFDFSVDTYGVGGNKVYNGKKAQRFGGENIEYASLQNFWTPSNPNAENPTPFNDVPIASTYYIEDGSYLRINNITIGYTLPKFFNQINKVRVYATAVNPFIITKFSGYSPEISGGDGGNPLGSAGIELDAYPTNKTFLLGLNVIF